MSFNTIIYKRTVNFEGRNGFLKQGGIEIGADKDRVSLFPINSRLGSSRGMLEIPMENLTEFIDHLQEIKKDLS